MAMEHEFQPRMIGFVCNWCCYGGADLCGVSRFQYPPHIRLIRVMCSARVDLLHILRAFSREQDGVFVGGCHFCDCHYVTNGNFNAFSMVQVSRKILAYMGVNPERLRIEWVSAGEGIRFADFMNEFSAQLQQMGPLGKAEGIEESALKRKLEAVHRLVPYIKLVLTQKLNVADRTEEAYRRFFTSEEFDRLFEESIASRLAMSQIMLLLRERPLSMGAISELLRLNPTAVSAHLTEALRRGLVCYDVAGEHYRRA
ncbi:MAG: hydrogenase iron-sulfur subunit [Acidobacteria bacterium]|nr:hydrogenase iron-sulfur subunit [Acidobacteriota bacterium]